MQIELSMEEVKAQVLYDFFMYIERLVSEVPNQDLSAASVEDYYYFNGLIREKVSDKGTCKKWIKGAKKDRDVGVLFRINGGPYFICVVAAAKSMVIGVINEGVVKVNSEYSEAMRNLKLEEETKNGYWKQIPTTWYTHIIGKNIVSFDEKSIDFLTERDGRVEKIIGEILSEFKLCSVM